MERLGKVLAFIIFILFGIWLTSLTDEWLVRLVIWGLLWSQYSEICKG